MNTRRSLPSIVIPALTLAVTLLASLSVGVVHGKAVDAGPMFGLPVDSPKPPGTDQGDEGQRVRLATSPISIAVPDPSGTSQANPQDEQIFYPSADTMILEGFPADTHGSYEDMMVGYDDLYWSETARSLIYFDLSSRSGHQAIDTAMLRVYLIDAWDYPDMSRTVTTYRVADTWTEAGTTWNNQPGFGEAYDSRSVGSSASGWYEFDVTSLVRAWETGTYANHGIMLRGPEVSGDDASWRAFSTREGAYSPELVIKTSAAISKTAYLPLVNKPLVESMGAEGGELAHPYGASLSLPSGSIPDSLEFSIDVQDNPPAPLPEGVTQAGKAVRYGPSDIYFGVPARLQLPLPSGVDPYKVNLLTYKEGTWYRVPAKPDGDQIVAGVSSLSWFVATIDPYPDEFQPKAFVFENNTHEPVTVRLRSWALRYPEQAWLLPGPNWSLGLGEFDFWRSDQECVVFPQGEYTFWVYNRRLDRSCWIGPYSLGPNDAPWCWAGERVAFDLLWTGLHCWPGDPTGNVPGRPVLSTGSLQFILTWNTYADLDLHVQGPDGYIWYANPGPTANGGALRLDVQCDNWPGPPASENIVWPVGQAPTGSFVVSVAYWSDCGTGARNVPYTLQVLDNGSWVRRWEGTLAEPYPVREIPFTSIPAQSKMITGYSR